MNMHKFQAGQALEAAVFRKQHTKYKLKTYQEHINERFQYEGHSFRASVIYIHIYISDLFTINVTIISRKALIGFLNPHFSFGLISLDNTLHFFAHGASVVMF